MSTTAKISAGVVAAIVTAVSAFFFIAAASAYQVKFLIPSAAQLAEGSPVLIRGFKVGKVESLEVRDAKPSDSRSWKMTRWNISAPGALARL